MAQLENMQRWHAAARPTPTAKNLSVQMGCHFEEVAEMLEAIWPPNPLITHAHDAVKKLADAMKAGALVAYPHDRKALLDSLADQVVTAVGVGHCAGMNVPEACQRVNDSNFSKFDQAGQPIFNENGKIAKGPDYFEPNLDGLY